MVAGAFYKVSLSSHVLLLLLLLHVCMYRLARVPGVLHSCGRLLNGDRYLLVCLDIVQASVRWLGA
jgi:hypothetical protein